MWRQISEIERNAAYGKSGSEMRKIRLTGFWGDIAVDHFDIENDGGKEGATFFYTVGNMGSSKIMENNKVYEFDFYVIRNLLFRNIAFDYYDF